jgi:hypothetical protein
MTPDDQAAIPADGIAAKAAWRRMQASLDLQEKVRILLRFRRTNCRCSRSSVRCAPGKTLADQAVALGPQPLRHSRTPRHCDLVERQCTRRRTRKRRV